MLVGLLLALDVLAMLLLMRWSIAQDRASKSRDTTASAGQQQRTKAR